MHVKSFDFFGILDGMIKYRETNFLQKAETEYLIIFRDRRNSRNKDSRNNNFDSNYFEKSILN